MFWVLAIAILLAAAVNWYSRTPFVDPQVASRRWLEWTTKPAVTLGLIAMATTVAAADRTQQRWFVVGLVFCLVGDVALMWQPELFRSGLVSFLLGHVAFVIGFAIRSDLAPLWSIALGAVALLICLAVAARHLLPSVRRGAPQLLVPVSIYVVIIAAMAIASWRGGHWAAPTGAATFAVSDLTLADNKFVARRQWSPVAVMFTYHAALALLVLSLR